MQDWYKTLFSINSDFGCLACLVAWGIWKARTRLLFDDIFTKPFRVSCFIRALSAEYRGSSQKSCCSGNRARIDGAALASTGLWGAGAFIELFCGDQIKLWMFGRRGTNTKGKLLALWMVLFFSTRANISLEQVAGDSLVIVN